MTSSCVPFDGRSLPPSWWQGLLAGVARSLEAELWPNVELAEEAAAAAIQRLWQTVWDSSRAFASAAHMKNWTVLVGRRLGLDELRQRRRHCSLPETRGDASGRPGFRGLRPRQESLSVEHLEAMEGVAECLDLLPPADRAVLRAFYHEGLTDQQVGDRLAPPSVSRQGRLLRAHRRRRQAERRVAVLLLNHGVDPCRWNMQRRRPSRRWGRPQGPGPATQEGSVEPQATHARPDTSA